MDSPHALVRQAVCQMFAGLARLQPALVCTRTTADGCVRAPCLAHTDGFLPPPYPDALATDPQVLGQPLIPTDSYSMDMPAFDPRHMAL